MSFTLFGRLSIIISLTIFSALPSFSSLSGSSHGESVLTGLWGSLCLFFWFTFFTLFRWNNFYGSTSVSLTLCSSPSILLLTLSIRVLIMLIVFSVLRFPFGSSYIIRFFTKTLHFFAKILIVFIHFKHLLNCSLKRFYLGSLKSLSNDSNICHLADGIY